MNRRREKLERDERIDTAELMALRAQVQATVAVKQVQEATAITNGLRAENAALRAALVKKEIITDAELDAAKVAIVPE